MNATYTEEGRSVVEKNAKMRRVWNKKEQIVRTDGRIDRRTLPWNKHVKKEKAAL